MDEIRAPNAENYPGMLAKEVAESLCAASEMDTGHSKSRGEGTFSPTLSTTGYWRGNFAGCCRQRSCVLTGKTRVSCFEFVDFSVWAFFLGLMSEESFASVRPPSPRALAFFAAFCRAPAAIFYCSRVFRGFRTIGFA